MTIRGAVSLATKIAQDGADADERDHQTLADKVHASGAHPTRMPNSFARLEVAY